MTGKRYAVIGHPVAHSVSPCMHAALLREHRIEGSYLAIDIPPEGLGEAMRGMLRELDGFSVTMPHKESILAMLDEIDPLARRIGAVNAVRRDGARLIGHNTDWLGAVEPIERVMPLRGAKVTVLGAGGAARAAVLGLVERGALVTVRNRTVTKAEALARELGCAHAGLLDVEELDADIVVNATSVGMHPRERESPLPARALRGVKAVFDLIYAPQETVLLRDAREAGCIAICGIEMLAHQGAHAFALWTGITPDIDNARAQALRCIRLKEEGQW